MVDCDQGAAHVFGDFDCATLFGPVGEFHDGGFEGQLISLLLHSMEGKRSEFGIAIPPGRGQRDSRNVVSHEWEKR